MKKIYCEDCKNIVDTWVYNQKANLNYCIECWQYIRNTVLNEQEALEKWWFKYDESDWEYINITHCWENSEIICHFPWITTVECKKCWQELTQKILIWECFLKF